MLNLSIKELKVIAKIRGIEGYKSMSEDIKKLVKIKSKKRKTNFYKARIESIRKEFNQSRHKFSKSKINEIRRNLYETEIEKSLFESKKKRFQGILLN